MWPESSTTQQLLNNARGGDARAINCLLDRHRSSLRRLIDLRLDPRIAQRVDASDIVQEVMIDAHRRLTTYLQNPQMPFHLWLRQMALDRMIDAHRRRRVAARRSLDREQPLQVPSSSDQSTFDLAAQIADRQLTPAAAATWHELKRRFEKALEHLEDPDREIVLVRHFEQLTNSEAAQALGLSQQAAAMRYLRAMRKLRKLLAEELPPRDV